MKKITNFAINYDEDTKQQFTSCYNEKFVLSASLMPDAHSGYVAPIGSVLITKDFIVPSWIGYDIGCGMIAIKIGGKELSKDIQKDAEKIYEIINNKIPMGKGNYNNEKNISLKTKQEFTKLLERFKTKDYNKEDYNYISSEFSIKNLGSLGSGNHFIELSLHQEQLWLIIHSGSRKIGHTLAEKYMKLSQKINKGQGDFEKTFAFNVSSKEGKNYIKILNFCLDYALLNRLEIAYQIHLELENFYNKKIKFTLWTNKNHNHAIIGKNIIHRKGATPAEKGERGVIPGNMKDGSFLVEGKGNPEFLMSSSHGAGRKLSRTEARKKINLEEFKKTMKGIHATVNQHTIEEAPQAYKDIFKVMEAQKKSIKIIAHLKPIINWKG